MATMSAPKKGKPGRPELPTEDRESLYLTIRISESRKALYEAAAKRAGETLSAWVKRLLDRASKAK
jgi:predicted HicB family RNase H-like nuclease